MRKVGIYRNGWLYSKDLQQASRAIVLKRTKRSQILFLLVFVVTSLGLSGCYFEPPGYYGGHEYREHHHHHDHDY